MSEAVLAARELLHWLAFPIACPKQKPNLAPIENAAPDASPDNGAQSDRAPEKTTCCQPARAAPLSESLSWSPARYRGGRPAVRKPSRKAQLQRQKCRFDSLRFRRALAPATCNRRCPSPARLAWENW